MAAQFFSYEGLAKRLLTLPFIVNITVACAVFSMNDLLHSIQAQVQQAQVVSQLLAKTAASKNTALISQQVEEILNEHDVIRSIMFFPVDQAQNVTTDKQNLTNYLTLPYLGISEPVLLDSAKRTINAKTSYQLIGYINVTLDMQEIRYEWLKRNAPVWLAVILLSLLPLLLSLRRLKSVTQRFPLIHSLSERVLNNEDIDINEESSVLNADNDKQVSSFEQALFYLINKQKMQRHQIETLMAAQISSRDKELEQVHLYSNFQNTITQELKLSVGRIQSGLQLLQNQYISNEQKDAVDMIDLGTDDLNAKLNQIIQMIRIEKGQTTYERVKFSPIQLITDIANEFQLDARNKDILLVSKLHHADYQLEGDLQKIRTILSSLVDNAIKFTDAGRVTIDSKMQHLEKSIRWTIEVQDTGIGIDDKYIQKIFEPFFQVEPDQRHHLRHNNIGLYLAKKLAKLISGELNVSSQLNQGSVFSLSLVLDDWKNDYDRTVLAGKRIAIWYEEKAILKYASRLSDAGADIATFSEESALMQHVMNQPIDALLISYKIPVDSIKRFIKILRQYETTHRVLIIVYYHSKLIKSPDLESLKVMGADYLEKIDKVDMYVNEHIQRIVDYLS